jgi:hypothetical protein
MPTVIVENVPPEIYERLQQRAAADRRSLPEVVLYLVLKQAKCSFSITVGIGAADRAVFS